jgi:hypothetical protein
MPAAHPVLPAAQLRKPDAKQEEDEEEEGGRRVRHPPKALSFSFPDKGGEGGFLGAIQQVLTLNP